MNNIFKTISIFAVILISIISTLLKIDNIFIFILDIIFSSIFIFYIGRENKRHTGFLKHMIIFLFWNITYFVIKDGFIISNDKLIDILKNSILLKDVFLNILPAIAYGYLLSIFTNEKISTSIIFQIILVGLSIYFSNEIFFLCAVFLFGRLFDDRKKLDINNSFFEFFNNFNFGIYIFHKFILDLLIYFNIAKYGSISDVFGSLVIIYIISLIIGYYSIHLPIIRKLIEA